MEEATNTDFIPNLPAGPLDPYRKQATFDWKMMKIVLETTSKVKLKLDVWKTIERDPLFKHTTTSLSMNEMKRLTALRFKKLFDFYFLKRETIEKLLPINRFQHLMTIDEALVQVFPDVSVKIGLSYSLFLTALHGFGTERHQEFIEAALNGKIVAAFAITEMSHGSNTKDMMTRATYEPRTEEFIIHTPCFEAAKCYVGNLGRTCTVVLLLAQLYAEDECKGMHVFVVPVRDPKTMLPFPGITIGDIGEKGGLNGIDNGFILFNNYRIPREYLLNRTGDVTPAGVYESSITDPTRILGAALEMLSAARMGVIHENTSIIASAVTIAVRYAAVRKQFSGENGDEIPIIEYPLHQLRLFPYVAASYVFRIYIEMFYNIYIDVIEKSNSALKIDNLSDLVSEIHALVSSTKPLITWTCRDAIQECREACGGFGYLKSAGLCDLRNNQDPSVTYEGDNNVLSQQTSKWLVRQWLTVQKGDEKVASPIGTCQFFNSGNEILKRKFHVNRIEDVKNYAFLFESFEWLICWLASVTNQEFSRQNGRKMTPKNDVNVYRMRIIPQVYAENVVLNYYWNQIKKQQHNHNMYTVLEQLGLLYGFWCLDKHLVYFYEGGYASGPNLGKFVKETIMNLCQDLKPNAIAIVDALAPPDYVLNSVIGKADGQLYLNLQEQFLRSEGATSRANWWKEIANPDAPDFRKCKL